MGVKLSNFTGGTAACVRAGKQQIRLLNELNRMKRLQAEWPIDCQIYYRRDNGQTIPGLVKQISKTGLSIRIHGNFPDGDRLVWVATTNLTKQERNSAL